MPPVLLALALGAPADPVRAIVTPTHVEFRAGDKLVTSYHYAGEVRQEKVDANKPLAKPYFWPLVAPNGLAVTRDWPMDRSNPKETTDHFHQKSVWFCHGDVIPDGVELKLKSASKEVKGADFWSEFPNHGRIVTTKLSPEANGAGEFVSECEWHAADGTPVLAERRAVAVRQLERGSLITVRSELTAKFCPVTFGDTKEGSMGVRVRDEFRTLAENGGVVTSSNGAATSGRAKGTLPMWGEVAAWHDYSGRADGKAAGVAIFTDPANAHPSAWHTRDYGLMAANPFGRAHSGYPSQKGKTDLVKLAKGESLALRFGVYVHDGDAREGRVAEAFAAFAGK